MKLKILILIPTFFALTGILYSQNALNEITEFGNNSGNLKMFVYVPSKQITTIQKLPLVIALHGCNQNASIVAKQAGWNKLADKHNFIVVYPQQKHINNASNCFNWFNEKDFSKNNGECASIHEMIKYAITNYNIDTSNVFIYGVSAGAAMSVNMLSVFPTVFKSGAILAGCPFGLTTNAFDAIGAMRKSKQKTGKEWGELVIRQNDSLTKYPKLIIVHGLKDLVVNYKNSIELVKQWTYIHQLDSANMHIDSFFTGNKYVMRQSIKNNLSKEEIIIFYSIAKTGHVIPIDPGKKENQGGETGMFTIDRDFFSTYYIAKDFGLLK